MPTDGDALPLPPVREGDERPYIYVVNSDPDFLEMIGELLADARAQVTLEQMRPNVDVTLANLRLARPDVLLLDVVPFQRDAQLLLDRLEQDATLGELPVILASTIPAVAEQLAETHASLVRDILSKPFDIDDFFTILHRVVTRLHVP